MAGSLQEAFNQQESISFTIVPGVTQGSEIPRNYFCQWNIDLDVNQQYWITITRGAYPVMEELTLNIIGLTEQSEVTDDGLRATSPFRESELFLLRDTDEIEIYARNKYESLVSTFEIRISQVYTYTQQAEMMESFLSLIFLLMICCTFLLCVSILSRVRCKRRVSDDEIDRELQNADNESQARRLSA